MKTFRRLLHPFAAASAFALAIVAQPVVAGASPDHEDAASMRAGDSPVRLGAASPGADAFARADAGVPAAKATASPSAGRSPGGSTTSPGGSTGSPGSPSGSPGSPASSPGSPTSSPGGSVGAPKGDVPKGLEKFYGQKVNWAPCKDKPQMQCANVEVPLDYKKPGGKAITVAMAKLPAKGGKPMGSLFINPGGPGSSGIAMVDVARQSFGKDVLDKYDVVGFDPRGVGSSTPVDCVDDRELGKILDSDIDTSTEAGRKARKAQARQIAKGCKDKSGELLAHVGTEPAARDMDVLRGLVGDEKLNYLGLSYGTQLGGAYADLFPKKVGRMVLDGAANPQQSFLPSTYTQMLSFEKSFERYAERCVKAGNCSLGPSVDAAKKKMRALLDQARVKPFKTSDPNRPLNQAMLHSAVISLLYEDRTWSVFNQAFDQLIKQNDGSLFLKVFDATSSREGDGNKGNRAEAYWAINCADYAQESEADYQKYAKKLKREAVVFGSFSAEDDLAMHVCAELPYHPKSNPGPYRAKGSAPIVVIGTRHDPATPYSWAQNMRKTLDNSVLLTREGDGHTAYGRGSSCIGSAVDKYLLTGEVPKDGLVCPVEKPQGQLPQKQGAPDRKASVKDEVFAGKPRPFVR